MLPFCAFVTAPIAYGVKIAANQSIPKSKHQFWHGAPTWWSQSLRFIMWEIDPFHECNVCLLALITRTVCSALPRLERKKHQGCEFSCQIALTSEYADYQSVKMQRGGCALATLTRLIMITAMSSILSLHYQHFMPHISTGWLSCVIVWFLSREYSLPVGLPVHNHEFDNAKYTCIRVLCRLSSMVRITVLTRHEC